jgi:hypothetical protein
MEVDTRYAHRRHRERSTRQCDGHHLGGRTQQA